MTEQGWLTATDPNVMARFLCEARIVSKADRATEAPSLRLCLLPPCLAPC